MALPRTTAFCPICGTKLQGRLDKFFIQIPVNPDIIAIKMRNGSLSPGPLTLSFRPIDSILHRNWKILSEYHAAIGKKKFFVSLAQLNRQGFHPNYYTTSAENSQQKKYFYVYDFGWMMFTDKEVMVIKLDKPK